VADGLLHDVLINWGSFFANHAAVRTLVTFLHVGAIVGAGGAAVTADRGILAAWRLDDRARLQQLVALRQTHRIVVAGLACIALSGLLLFASDVDSFLYSKIFWTKMSLVGLLLVNGTVLVSAEDRAAGGAAGAWRTLHFTAFASAALWFLVTLAGVALLNIG
jgi:uncharacterized membrane protein